MDAFRRLNHSRLDPHPTFGLRRDEFRAPNANNPVALGDPSPVGKTFACSRLRDRPSGFFPGARFPDTPTGCSHRQFSEIPRLQLCPSRRCLSCQLGKGRRADLLQCRLARGMGGLPPVRRHGVEVPVLPGRHCNLRIRAPDSSPHDGDQAATFWRLSGICSSVPTNRTGLSSDGVLRPNRAPDREGLSRRPNLGICNCARGDASTYRAGPLARRDHAPRMDSSRLAANLLGNATGLFRNRAKPVARRLPKPRLLS